MIRTNCTRECTSNRILSIEKSDANSKVETSVECGEIKDSSRIKPSLEDANQ